MWNFACAVISREHQWSSRRHDVNLIRGDASAALHRSSAQVKLLHRHTHETGRRTCCFSSSILFTFLIVLIPSLGSGAAALLSHSLVVHGEPCSSLERPTPLIFIPTLHPHLHLSPPPRPPHPSLTPSLPYLTSSRTLPPPSLCPPPLPHVPSLASVSRRALYMQNAPSSSSSSSAFVLPSLLFTFTTQLLTSHTFVWKPPQGFPPVCCRRAYAAVREG